jgi:ubiquinone/menaquinone biosynthesis C-methylase UbiE
MNRFHRRYCASPKWEKLMLERLLPDALDGVSLGDNVLELGPGPGLTTLALARTAPRVTAVEIDRELAQITRDRTRSCGNVEVVEGDATALPFDDARYSSVVCMTMLHHLHDAAAQDRLFAEACRVLQPGGVLCGSDNLGRGIRFRVIHIGDTRTVVDPETLPARLKNAGFDRVDVRTGSRLVFRGYTSVAA